ncbi:hypothetical protein GLOIN_2v1791852 [Rhizophagus clarus]|uniref:Uncharacterized protein n=1 Tax=Rhizophagus clarus TaxID=94130 RepID=A0A8H3QPG9_9GLOM|nr:hypothetical protein GLOIN_2v1791852 [Rhizophagus clarus]
MVRHDVDSILAQRTQSASDDSDESDQYSVANNSEASSQSKSSHESSYSGSSSSNSSFFENVETCFKQIFNSLRGSDSVDYMCIYSKYSTVKLISKWLDSKENISSLDNNTE